MFKKKKIKIIVKPKKRGQPLEMTKVTVVER